MLSRLWRDEPNEQVGRLAAALDYTFVVFLEGAFEVEPVIEPGIELGSPRTTPSRTDEDVQSIITPLFKQCVLVFHSLLQAPYSSTATGTGRSLTTRMPRSVLFPRAKASISRHSITDEAAQPWRSGSLLTLRGISSTSTRACSCRVLTTARGSKLSGTAITLGQRSGESGAFLITPLRRTDVSRCEVSLRKGAELLCCGLLRPDPVTSLICLDAGNVRETFFEYLYVLDKNERAQANHRS